MTNGMTLKTKLIGLTLVTIAGLCILFTILLLKEKNQLMGDRQEKVRNLVEVAHSTVTHYHKQAQDGKIDVVVAKQQALEALRAMRYEKTEYFWINDLDDVMVMHPIKPEMDGKKLDKLQDKNGKHLFLVFNEVVKKDGSGFVDYVWPKPGFDAPVPKISYVKGFQPWGWVIGSGIYIDDVEAIFRQNAMILLGWGLLIGGFIAVSLILVGRNLLIDRAR